MINRKCTRCKEITGTLHGGKKIKEEFLCEDCLQKGIASGEIELSQVEEKQTTYLSIKILKIMSAIYLIGSILMAFSTGPFIHNLGFDEISISGSELGLISIVYARFYIPVRSRILRDMGIYPFSRNSH